MLGKLRQVPVAGADAGDIPRERLACIARRPFFQLSLAKECGALFERLQLVSEIALTLGGVAGLEIDDEVAEAVGGDGGEVLRVLPFIRAALPNEGSAFGRRSPPRIRSVCEKGGDEKH